MRNFSIIICFLTSTLIYGQISIQDDLYNDNDSFIKFSSNRQIEMWNIYDYDPDPSEAKKADPNFMQKRDQRLGTYNINNENGIDFITVRWENGTTDRYLILLIGNERSPILYAGDGKPYFNSTKFKELRPYGYAEGNGGWITASSSLTEGSTRYSTDKLGFNIGECWAEGVKGYGIGETLTLNLLYTPYLYISSGFVSFSKPHLFRENTRIKRIKFSNEFGESEEILLKDMPHFQVIDTEMSLGTGVFKIEILEVYPGTKYTDTCVNSILGIVR